MIPFSKEIATDSKFMLYYFPKAYHKQTNCIRILPLPSQRDDLGPNNNSSTRRFQRKLLIDIRTYLVVSLYGLAEQQQ
jgi:hypothetical protein